MAQRKLGSIIVEPYDVAVARGKIDFRTIWNKFGYNQSVPNSTTEQIIAPWGGAFDPTTDIMTTDQTFTITYDQTVDGAGTTGALSLMVIGVKTVDGVVVNFTQFHTLGNTGTDVTSFSGIGINRVNLISNGGLGWNAADITFTATTDGTTQAEIPAEGSVTQQLIFHTQQNYNFQATWVRFNVRKLSKGGSDIFYTVKGYSWSRVTLTRYEVFRENDDTGLSATTDIKPSEIFTIGGREVLYFTATSDTNSTVVNGRFSGKEILNK